jgi:hypothetical protein
MKEIEMCCSTTCNKEIVKAEFEALAYIARELSGCIDEYQAMPEKSLLQALFVMNDRLKGRIGKPSAEIEALKKRNTELTALVEDMKELCLTTEEVNQIKVEAVRDFVDVADNEFSTIELCVHYGCRGTDPSDLTEKHVVLVVDLKQAHLQYAASIAKGE